MGRWAQRRLGSSSGSGAGPIVFMMTLAQVEGTTTIRVTWNTNVDPADFAGSDFSIVPSGANVTLISQDAPTSLVIDFDDDITSDTDLTYGGTAPGLLSPQTIGIT